MAYTIESLNRLSESLDATNVLSDNYKSMIMSYAMDCVSAGHAEGKAQAQANSKDAKALREVRAKLDLLGRDADGATTAKLDEIHKILDSHGVERTAEDLLKVAGEAAVAS